MTSYVANMLKLVNQEQGKVNYLLLIKYVESTGAL